MSTPAHLPGTCPFCGDAVEPGEPCRQTAACRHFADEMAQLKLVRSMMDQLYGPLEPNRKETTRG